MTKFIMFLLLTLLITIPVLADDLTKEAATNTVLEQQNKEETGGFWNSFVVTLFKESAGKMFKAITEKFSGKEPEPTTYVRLGDGKWHDVSCVISQNYLGYVNQKWGNRGDAVFTVIAAFDKPQKAMSKKYDEPKSVASEEPNMGKQTNSIITKINPKDLESFLKTEGLLDQLSTLKNAGSHYYKISTTAKDQGYYAAFNVKLSSKPIVAFAKVTLDDYSANRARLHMNGTWSKPDKNVVCTQSIKVNAVDINKKPLDDVTIAFKENKKNQKRNFDKSFSLSGPNFPTKVFLSKDFNGEVAKTKLDNIKPGKSYAVIIATEEVRLNKYKEDLTRIGKLIYGPNFKLEDYYSVVMSTKNQYHNKKIYIESNLIASGSVESPYHEGMHALWEHTSISNAAGTRDNMWKALPENEENLGIIHDNFALDEAQAHLAGFFAKKYYHGETVESTEYSVNKAKDALEHTWVDANQLEGAVTVLLVQGYGAGSFDDATKDMMKVKESYKNKHGKYPMNIGQFLHEKLQSSTGKEKQKWESLAKEIGIKASLNNGLSVKLEEKDKLVDYSKQMENEYAPIDSDAPLPENMY